MVESNSAESKLSLPPDGEQISRPQWLWAEVQYHLFPWGPGFLLQKPAMVAASISLAIAVTVAWMLAASGRVAPAIVIAWWTGWSVYECLCRLRCKPWIKEGLWWGGKYRRASTADMISYVATKNLLIGAGLFLLLYLSGVLPATAR